MKAMKRQTLALAALASGLALPAAAADLPNASPSSLPSLAADPATQTPNWKGLYVGTGVAASFGKGSKAQFGGDAFAGYDRRFDNNLLLGLRFDAGYSPWAYSTGPYKGTSFGEADIKLGYAMGRLTPYVIAGAGLARPNYGVNVGDLNQTVNGLFSSPAAAQGYGTAGVGLDYALTNNVTVGVEARVSNGGVPSLLGPPR